MLYCMALSKLDLENLNKEILYYINRLSDYLFVVAREINIKKNKEVLWKPEKNKKK